MRNVLRKSVLGFSALVVGSAGVGTSLAACVSDANAPGVGSLDASFTVDGASPGFDAGPPSADGSPAQGTDATLPGLDGSSPTDAGPVPDDANAPADSALGDASGYTDVSAASNWTTFDPTTLDAGIGTFDGQTFDGRYIYFAPYGSTGVDGIVSRYDTQKDIADPSGWTTFDLKVGLGTGGRFAGTVFDGRYVYFVPFFNAASQYDSNVVQYDTHGAFTAASSWTQYTMPETGPFWGGIYDGRYVYFAPHFYSQIPIYDTQAGPLTSPAAWSYFDPQTLTPPVAGNSNDTFAGALFDGKYAYFLGPIVARRDTTVAQDAGAAAWETSDTRTVYDAGALTDLPENGGFDGRYLYLIDEGSAVVTRYDTQAPFTSQSSWSTFDVGTADGGTSGYESVGFDGRFLYFAPLNTTMAIYDTQAPFQAASSWSTLDTATIYKTPYGYANFLFDGEYLYMTATAGTGSILLRAELKTTRGPLPSLPLFHGSFL
jgi:hypothetical protein